MYLCTHPQKGLCVGGGDWTAYAWLVSSCVINVFATCMTIRFYSVKCTHKQVIQVFLEECSTNMDCMSCTGDINPLCGWCTVENKCSRSSLCQNAGQTLRWVQDSTECVSVELSTTQFVIDNPQSVRVQLQFVINAADN